MLEQYDELLECEAELGRRLDDVSLIGQVEISPDDLVILGLFISDLMSESPKKGTNYLRSRTPVSLCFFMVWAGVYYYVPLYHDFWNYMHQNGGLPESPAWQAQWGKIFLGVLRDRGMPTFEEAGGLHYVTPILAQGGIPDECLHDFFDKLIWPIATGRLAVDVNDTDEIMREWQAKSSLFDFTDKPVRRFLIYGGKPAEDFLSRCIEMALSTIEEGVVPSADSLDIPARIVEKFEAWQAEVGARTRRSQAPRKTRFRAPRMILDPQYGEVGLELPTQVLEKELVWGDPVLQLTSGQGETVETPVSFSRRVETIESEPIRITIPYPAEKYEAKLITSGKVVKSWDFRGLTKEKPWLAFSGGRSECIRSGILPRSDVWLLFPSEAVIDGNIEVIEEAVEVFGQWASYKASHIDLSNADEITLRSAADVGSEQNTYESVKPIKVAAESFVEPELELDHLVGLVTCSSASVFRQPPKINIPIPIEELNRWRLSIVPRRSPTHSSRIEANLFQSPSMDSNGFAGVLDLNQESLLEGAVGEFLVRLRGPLGKDQRYSIVIVPELTIDFPKKLYTPGPTGASSADFILTAESLADCEVELPCELKREGEKWLVAAPPEVSRTQLVIGVTGRNGSQVDLSLEIEIPRMRIALRGLENRPVWKWSSEKIAMNMLQWEDSRDLSLLIETPGVDGGNARLLLRGASHEETRRLIDGRAFFPLKGFSDSLRSLGHAEADFTLDIDAPDATSTRVPVLTVQTQWVIESFEVMDELIGEERQLIIEFEERTHVNNRLLRFWDLWRPWKEPIEMSVPDQDQALSAAFPIGQFPAGEYRIEFLVEDPWAVPVPIAFPPTEDGQTVFGLEIGDAQEREFISVSKVGSPIEVIERLSWIRRMGGDVSGSIEMFAGTESRNELALEALAALFLSWLPDGWVPKTNAVALWDSIAEASFATGDHEFPTRFLISLGRFTSGKADVVKQRARMLCVGTGLVQQELRMDGSNIGDSERSAVSSMWPAMGVLMELSVDGLGEGSTRRLSAVLGEIPLTEILNLPLNEGTDLLTDCAGVFEDCLDCRLRGKPECGCAGVDCSVRFWGGTEARDLRTLLEKSQEVLDLIYGHLGLHPVGVLHEDSYLLALKQWLESRQIADRRNVEFVEKRRSHIERSLAELRMVPYMSPYVEAVLARIPPNAYQPLVYVPFLIGGIALIQRCAAHGIYIPRGLSNLRDAGTEAYLLAPDLYVRDLCLSDLTAVVVTRDNEASEVEIGEP